MPNHVLIISAIPNNNLFKLKLPIFQTIFCNNTWKFTWIKLQTDRSTFYTCLSLTTFWILALYRLKSSVRVWAWFISSFWQMWNRLLYTISVMKGKFSKLNSSNLKNFHLISFSLILLVVYYTNMWISVQDISID